MSIAFHLKMQKKQFHVASPCLFSTNPKDKPSTNTLQMKTFPTSGNLECYGGPSVALWSGIISRCAWNEIDKI